MSKRLLAVVSFLSALLSLHAQTVSSAGLTSLSSSLHVNSTEATLRVCVVLAPVNLAAQPTGTGIRLTWLANPGSPTPLRYRIYRGTDSVSVSKIDSTSTTAFVDIPDPKTQAFCYRISAVDSAGHESPKSLAAEARADGLVALYMFSGNMADSSGNGKHLTNFGAVPAGSRFVQPNQAYLYNGTSTQATREGGFEIGEEVTLTAWIRPTPSAYIYSMVASLGVAELNIRLGYYPFNNKVGFDGRLNQAQAGILFSSGTAPVNQWTFVAGTLKDSVWTLYLDGALDQFVTFPRDTFQNVNFAVSNDPGPDNTDYFPGTIDDIRLYRRALAATEIDSLYRLNGWPIPPVVPNPGEYAPDLNTVLLLHMNEPSGSLVADASLFANNGTATGTTVTSGRFGMARTLNGSNEYIRVEHSPSFDMTSGKQISVEAWIKVESFPSLVGHVASKWGPGEDADDEWTLQFENTGKISFSVNSATAYGSPNTVLYSKPITLGTWVHVSGAWNGSTGFAALYINGRMDTSTTTAVTQIASTSSPVLAGWDMAGHYFAGLLDEVRISNKARSPGEFNLQLPPKGLTATPSGTTVNLAWLNGGGAAPFLRYKIYRGADSTNVLLIDSTTSTSYANSNLSTGMYFYRVSAVDSAGFEGAKSYASSATIAHMIHLPHVALQWKLVSISLLPPSLLASSLLPGAIAGPFRSQNGQYYGSDTLENGRGYWVMFATTDTVSYSGALLDSVAQQITVTSADRWVLVGSPSAAVTTSQVNLTGPAVFASDFFLHNGASYLIATTLEPGKAYWVLVRPVGPGGDAVITIGP